jgi:hypothetical protein
MFQKREELVIKCSGDYNIYFSSTVDIRWQDKYVKCIDFYSGNSIDLEIRNIRCRVRAVKTKNETIIKECI